MPQVRSTRRPFAPKPAAPPFPTLEQTSQRLEARGTKIDADINALHQRVEKLMRDSQLPQNELQAARMRHQAKQLLRRRKLLEVQQLRLEDERLNIDRLAFHQEEAQANSEVHSAMRAASQVSTHQASQISGDHVDEMMLDMQDIQADIKEVGRILSTLVDVFDDAELEVELDAVMAEELIWGRNTANERSSQTTIASAAARHRLGIAVDTDGNRRLRAAFGIPGDAVRAED
jgi:hypothetical protein